TMIEYGHRLAAAAVSVLVAGLAGLAWWLRRGARSEERDRPDRTSYTALGLLMLQILLGAVTVKLQLPPWTVLAALTLGFGTVLLGALTANLGAASACLGFPLCNGALFPSGNYLQYVHWTHRLLAFALLGYSLWWAVRSRRRGAWWVVALVAVQITVAAAMVLLMRRLQARRQH